MKRLILEQSDAELIPAILDWALVGLCLNRYGQLNQSLEEGIQRIKTLIQELMYLAARLIHTCRRLKQRCSQTCLVRIQLR